MHRTASRVPLARGLILVGIVVGVSARLIAVCISPQTGYFPDHISHMGRFNYAFEHGPWHVYDMKKGEPFVVRQTDRRTGMPAYTVKLNPHAVNYPPFAAYMFWLQGGIWHALDHKVVTLQIPPDAAQRMGITPQVSSRVLDTLPARFADGFPGMGLDFALAWGIAMLVRALAGRRRPLHEAVAFLLTVVAPPIFLDSAFWIQFESWLATLLVWCLVCLLRGRLVVAGVLYGVALMTKPQAILLGPVFVYLFFALRFMPEGAWRRALGLWKTVVAAIVVVVFIAAPFMIADANSPTNEDGALRWLKRSYIGTIGSDLYQRTTLSAFNVWWLDLISHGSPPEDRQERAAYWPKVYGSEQPLLGAPKALIGKVLLALGIIAAWVLCARKYRWSPESWVVVTYLTMLCAFMLPTSVHERYIYYSIPFLIALAVHRKTWVFPLAVLLIVGTCEMVVFRWASLRHVFAPGSTVRYTSGFLAVLMVGALLYSYAVLLLKTRPTPQGQR